MSARLVVLRAESGPSIGAGHVRRTRAVALALAARGTPARVLVDDPGSAAALRDDGLDAALAGEAAGWPAEAAVGWLDGVRDWAPELDALRAAGARTCLVEPRAGRERADLVVWPALHWRPDAWDRAHAERVRGGAPWIPLAPELVARAPAGRRDLALLVTFGASDPNRLSERALAGLARAGADARGTAVAVGAHMEPRRPALAALARAVGAEVVAGARDLSPWMARARAALTAVGTTLYELAYLRTPALVVGNYAHDAPALAHYAEHGPHRPLGLHEAVGEEALGRALRAVLEGPPPAPERPAGLGGGAAALAERLAALAG